MNEPTPRTEPLSRASLSFGQRVRDLRRFAGLTQREIAGHLGISRRTVIRYEQGSTHQPRPWTLRILEEIESEFAGGFAVFRC